jgi:hypothetical protein
VKITLFRVEEANRMVGEIRSLVERLASIQRRLIRLQDRIAVLTLAAAGAAADNPDARELAQTLVERRRLTDQLQRGVEAIHSRGPVVKSVEHGLIDFYSVAGDRLIFLCWRLGEPEVAHWHSLEGGFAGRQRLHPSELE